MKKEQYEELVSRQNELDKLYKEANHPKHKRMISDELIDIRKQISNAHRERYIKRNSK